MPYEYLLVSYMIVQKTPLRTHIFYFPILSETFKYNDYIKKEVIIVNMTASDETELNSVFFLAKIILEAIFPFESFNSLPSHNMSAVEGY